MKLIFRYSIAALMCLVMSYPSARAAENEGKWSIGVRPGIYKLVMTDHSDAWTPGWLLNADIKYGLTNRWNLGVEGSWMKTYAADFSGKDSTEGAGASFKKVSDGAQQRAYLAGLIAQYNFADDAKWMPYATVGAGMYIWKWTDKDGNTLMSNSPALFLEGQRIKNIPKVDTAGNPYELKDQELYVMGGLGVEYRASDLISIGLGGRFRYLTHVFTSYKDEKDIVGTDPGQLDLPKGIVEGLLGLTFHLGQSCPPISASASAEPATGSVPVEVQFKGGAVGGCPQYTYAWNFGDGTTSTEANPKHTYAKEGTYTASLTITDSKKHPATSTASVTASCPPLQATASANPPGGDTPLSVKFQASSTGGCGAVTYAWNFGDGATSNEQNPTHTYATAGTMSPTLTVTDSKGVAVKQETPAIVTKAPFVPTAEKPIVLEGVHFQSNKAVLLPESSSILDRVAESLMAHPDVKVEVGGHTDSDGSAAANMKLSAKRADAVRDYLVKKGVPASQMTSKGYGETQPISDNKSPEGKAMNRRVELKRL
jgi:outer membrane protein OmpA-like peptidoglycan-associated protein/opacity protein-like surface antigen